MMINNKLMAAMVGEDVDVDFDVTCDTTDVELAMIRDAGDVEEMEYDVGTFVVNVGDGRFKMGYYPHYSDPGDDLENIGFYFGGLMLKIDDTWYLTPGMDPDENRYEIVCFVKMHSFEETLKAAVEMAKGAYNASK